MDTERAEPESGFIVLVKKSSHIINILLRYFAAGAAAILALGYTKNYSFAFLKSDPIDKDVSTAVFIVVTFVAGMSIYSIHRAILLTVIESVYVRVYLK